MGSWEALSAAGALAVTGALAGVITAALTVQRAWGRLQCWCVLFGAAMALVVASKLAFLGWGLGVPALHFRGISGHAARAAAVFPVLAWLLLGPGRRRGAAVAAGALLGMLVGVARVQVHAHSASEVVAGCLLGWGVAAGFIWHARCREAPQLGRATAVLCLPLVCLLASAGPVPTQVWLRSAARYLSGQEHAALHAPAWPSRPASKPAEMVKPQARRPSARLAARGAGSLPA
ncbi:phosphatase PAP2 family protein [Pseudoduganella aquatica]|uniref:phosphatase PAP2 family protein n=1 Tax=Pseudoduganella aquatica TaxID=2660641 RepID=UPI001E366857|nr:phosphatase PAP2 family protein [Pseudoduganella aquatica]